MKKNIPFQLLILISVFFFWGFVAASNDILIPVFKEFLDLSQSQAQLVSLSFYIAYTVGSVLYILISKLIGEDLLNKIGYKNGITYGLIFSALGTLLFYPAAEKSSFFIMILGLFIVGLGFSLQQTAANPLIINLGDQSKSAQRLNLAGGINNLGTTIGPVLVSMAIFGTNFNNNSKINNLGGIKFPYLILGFLFVLVAIIFKYSSIPNKLDIVNQKKEETTKKKGGIFQHPQLILGMIGIFVYVGVEVSTISNLPEYIKTQTNIPLNQIASFVSLYWASLMIGRWSSALGVFNLKGIWSILSRIIVPFAAFAVFLLINHLANQDITIFLPYGIVILVLIVADYISNDSPSKQLFLFSLLGVISIIIGINTTGLVSLFAFISVGLFCSTLWSCIFTLSISGLGNYTNQASSYLIMMIMGGGFISWFQGYLADIDFIGIRYSYFLNILCFAYLIYFSFTSKK